jgi:hypothetical protein
LGNLAIRAARRELPRAAFAIISSKAISNSIPMLKALLASLLKELASLPTELAQYCRQVPDRELRFGVEGMAPRRSGEPILLPRVRARSKQDSGTGHLHRTEAGSRSYRQASEIQSKLGSWIASYVECRSPTAQRPCGPDRSAVGSEMSNCVFAAAGSRFARAASKLALLAPALRAATALTRRARSAVGLPCGRHAVPTAVTVGPSDVVENHCVERSDHPAHHRHVSNFAQTLCTCELTIEGSPLLLDGKAGRKLAGRR